MEKIAVGNDAWWFAIPVQAYAPLLRQDAAGMTGNGGGQRRQLPAFDIFLHATETADAITAFFFFEVGEAALPVLHAQYQRHHERSAGLWFGVRPPGCAKAFWQSSKGRAFAIT